MAGEFRRAGAILSLGPAVLGPSGRIARGGQNWEGSAEGRISEAFWEPCPWKGHRMVVWYRPLR